MQSDHTISMEHLDESSPSGGGSIKQKPLDESTHDPNGVVQGMLQAALNTHHQRERVYGWKTTQNVFADAALIASIMLRKKLDAKDITLIFVAMKMARYGNTMELIELFKDDPEVLSSLEKSIYDSAMDGMVYMALSERERQKCVKSTKPTDNITESVYANHAIFPQKTHSGLPVCPFISWMSEHIGTGHHSPEDVGLSKCTHPNCKEDCEGNCTKDNCPLIRLE